MAYPCPGRRPASSDRSLRISAWWPPRSSVVGLLMATASRRLPHVVITWARWILTIVLRSCMSAGGRGHTGFALLKFKSDEEGFDDARQLHASFDRERRGRTHWMEASQHGHERPSETGVYAWILMLDDLLEFTEEPWPKVLRKWFRKGKNQATVNAREVSPAASRMCRVACTPVCCLAGCVCAVPCLSRSSFPHWSR